jgi:predicted metal-dependent TIM-barrel fold hydrolase
MMNKKEASIRLQGIDDFIRLFIAGMDTIMTIAHTPLATEEKKKLVDLLLGMRKVQVERYQKQIAYDEELK